MPPEKLWRAGFAALFGASVSEPMISEMPGGVYRILAEYHKLKITDKYTDKYHRTEGPPIAQF